jgi:DNA ligase (NAD+)
MIRIQELEALILKHKALYYQGRPEISDHDFDKLEEELRKLDADNAALSLVGCANTTLQKIKHEKKMLSLEKTYELRDLLKWVGKEEVLSTLKLDGISCSLVYEHGHLLIAKTRGDGVSGEDITAKALWIGAIPKSINEKNKIEIRGELFCIEENFFHLSQEMVSLGLDKPTSQRNIVAGLMGRKENLELCRYINFLAFDYFANEVIEFEEDKYKKLNNLGFAIPEIEVHKGQNSIASAIESAKIFMSEGDYQIDGLVFIYNKLALHEELGETAHHPRYKIAFKFPGESRATIIKEIVWSVSRNGILTPVAEVEPVELSGAMIQRVTLHNYGLVLQYDLKIGDKIEIIRSGEVIPKFLSVIESSKNEFKIPCTCPSCGSKIEILDIRIYCRNEECPGKNQEIILNFIQKIGIEDLSSKRLEDLINARLVKSIADLYRLTEVDLLKLDKVKEKLSSKLIESIAKSKNVDLVTFLAALGLSGGAYNKCEKVVRAGFTNIEKIKALNLESLMSIESFAEKSATDFLNSLHEKMKLIDELLALGFQITIYEKKETELTGKKICITGALSEKRQVIEERIRDCGGIVVSAVSKATDILVTNETDPTSSKFKKALELKTKIITESELMKKLK